MNRPAVAVLASLAANAATAQDRWPGAVDRIRQQPWWWVGGLGAPAAGPARTDLGHGHLDRWAGAHPPPRRRTLPDGPSGRQPHRLGRLWDARTGRAATALRTEAPLYACARGPEGTDLAATGLGGLYLFALHA
ncbi:hypothetical protein AB0953_22920 [Streptomyces sp. NPDC046866]|uniref:hypothetical protein n=1 Tax=Streptomyces sp. NPDC046866 TaxID=3154921 RepID=UPI0034535196